MRDAFGAFLMSYRDAAERVKSGEGKVFFPPDCFPSRLRYVSPA